MDRNWNTAQEREHFLRIWEYRNPEHKVQHTKQVWNERAVEWEKGLRDGERRERSDRRVKATAEYLRSRGLLKGTDDVIDIGCGPGRFVAEFAKTARHAVGTDLSGKMLEYGESFARGEGIMNTSYVEADFQTANLDELGWRGRFDLVFSSITPAINGNGLRKLIDMSRGWCFNSCFVHFDNELENELVRNVLKREPHTPWNKHWHWFYAMFNLLLLDGYYPETTYYREERSESVNADEDEARRWTQRIAEEYNAGEDTLYRSVADYLKKHADTDGRLVRRSDCVYGWILWNVNEKTAR